MLAVDNILIKINKTGRVKQTFYAKTSALKHISKLGNLLLNIL